MKKINVAHKIELVPKNEQIVYFAKACGISRMSYNWGLNRWNELYEENKNLSKEKRIKISGMGLKKEFNGIKEEKFPFVYEVTKYASQQPFLELDKAFKRFFNGTSKKPKFHKKNKTRDSFYIGGDQVKVEGNFLKIPNMNEKIKMREELRFVGKINSVTISRTAGKWFASIQVEMLKPTIKRNLSNEQKRSVGVDLGISSLVTLSNGMGIENPRFLKKQLKKLKRAQRILSRKYEASKKIKEANKDKEEFKDFRVSKNYIKQKNKVAKIHYEIACKRKDAIHKITNYLTKNFDEIVIEDLNVKGMVKNHNLAQALNDVSFGEFRRQLTYKSHREGCNLIIADRFYPSSKTCSCCGSLKKDLKLSERVFECESCLFTIDRDLNAARNLLGFSSANHVGKVIPCSPVEIASAQKSLGSLKLAFNESGSSFYSNFTSK